jgi:hypothetical protein
MSYIIVDVESDGPIPHKYSMVCFGAVVVEPSLAKTFYGKVKPIANDWIPDALAVSGFTRETHESFDDPALVMQRFATWIEQNSKGRRIGDLYCGMKMDAGLNSEWKRLHRKTAHDHHPVNDAKGNAEALLAMKAMGLKIVLV